MSIVQNCNSNIYCTRFWYISKTRVPASRRNWHFQWRNVKLLTIQTWSLNTEVGKSAQSSYWTQECDKYQPCTWCWTHVWRGFWMCTSAERINGTSFSEYRWNTGLVLLRNDELINIPQAADVAQDISTWSVT